MNPISQLTSELHSGDLPINRNGMAAGMEGQVADRRPLTTRRKRWPHIMAGLLARRRISPNSISIAGLAFGVIAGGLLAATAHVPPIASRILFLLAAGAIQLRLLCNLLDGLVAIEHAKASRLGELFNEIPDRISDAATLIGAGYAIGGVPSLGYLTACVALFIAYVRAAGKAAGARQEFCGPMAKQQRMFLVTLACVYCGLAPSAWQPTWRGAGVMSLALSIIITGGLFTAARRLRRIAAALRDSPR
jgi:phosphatidylglycerophosphate synthase